jgi:hypothetical protein
MATVKIIPYAAGPLSASRAIQVGQVVHVGVTLRSVGLIYRVPIRSMSAWSRTLPLCAIELITWVPLSPAQTLLRWMMSQMKLLWQKCWDNKSHLALG